jgi:hypothetical protein
MLNLINTEQQLVDFFEKVCAEVPLTQHTEVERHFYGSFEEVSAAHGNSTLKYPVAYIGALSGGLASHADSNYDIKNPTLVVLKSVEKEDFAAQRAARDLCLEIGIAIIEKAYQYYHETDYIQRMDLSKVKYDRAIGKLEYSVGYYFIFEIGSPRQIKNELYG